MATVDADEAGFESDGAARDRSRLMALAAFVPVLAAPGFSFGRWEQPPTDADGTMRLPYVELGPDAQAFLRAVGSGGWLRPAFDWNAWAVTDPGSALTTDPKAVATASPEDIARLLTALVRGDRFFEGTLAGAFESGMMLAVAERCAALLQGSGARPRASFPEHDHDRDHDQHDADGQPERAAAHRRAADDAAALADPHEPDEPDDDGDHEPRGAHG